MPKEWEKKEYWKAVSVVLIMGGFFIGIISLSIWQNVVNRDDRVSEAKEKINTLNCKELENYYEWTSSVGINIPISTKNWEWKYAKDLWIEKCTLGLKDGKN